MSPTYRRSLSALACLLSFALFTLPAAAVERASAWALSTSDTLITVGVANNRPIITTLRCKAQPYDWAAEQMPIPLIPKVWIGKEEQPTDWRFVDGKQDKASGKLTLTFTNADLKLILRSIWRARSGHGPVEHWIEIVNQTGKQVAVPQQDSLTLSSIKPGGEAYVQGTKRGGSNAMHEGGVIIRPVDEKLDLNLVSNIRDGSSPIPWMCVQVGTKRGLYVGWEFSGLGAITAKSIGDGNLAVRVGNLPDFKTDIEPGETFVVPAAFVGCYAGDIDDGSYTLHRWVIEYLRPKLPPGIPDPILAFPLYPDVGGENAVEKEVWKRVALCHDLGFEMFMPDAVWFAQVGDWRWDPKRFPDGGRKIVQDVHKDGMMMGLWCAWGQGGSSSDPGALSANGPVGHPDWFTGDVPPDWQAGGIAGAQLCLADSDSVKWAENKTQSLVADYKLDYLKHDIGMIATDCSRTDHRHHYGVDTSYWATLGYYQVQESLMKKYPGLMLENCESGGHMKDYGVIQRSHYTVATDTLSNLPDRQSIWDGTFALPPILLQAYTFERLYGIGGDEPTSFLWRSAMMSAWQLAPVNSTIWTDGEKDSMREAARTYKQWIRPMLRDVKVHHILPRPDGLIWDGMFYWSPSQKRGTVYIFRPDSKEESKWVKLKGLDPVKRYWVWCEDGSVKPGKRTGSELMISGLHISLPGKYTSDLIYMQDESKGQPKGMTTPGEFRLQAPKMEAGSFSVASMLTWQASPGAVKYRVTVYDAPGSSKTLLDRIVKGTSLSGLELPGSRKLSWKVEAISYGGGRDNLGGPASLQTPNLKPLPDVVFVSDMPWVSSTIGSGDYVRKDKNYYELPLEIGGTKYPKGLWTHSFRTSDPADVVVDTSGKDLGRFVADVGLDDDSRGAGSVVFQVLVDDVIKAESPLMLPGKFHRFDVDISGAKEVTLRVLNGGDGNGSDHACWGLARFIKAGTTDPLPPRD